MAIHGRGPTQEPDRATAHGRGATVSPVPPVHEPLDLIHAWPVPSAAAGWLRPDGEASRNGPTTRDFPLASVTKPLFAYAVLVAIEEGSIALDTPAPLPGVTVRHLLAHAGGLDPDRPESIAEPGTRRIYSNAGFEMLGAVLATATGFTADGYLRAAVLEPLGMANTELLGSPAHAAHSTVDDLLRFAAELLAPTLLDPSTLAEATSTQWPDIGGVLPGFGRQEPNPWGLGFEIRGHKSPHWTGHANSPETFGHFGRAGTMIWVDPVAARAAVALTDREFGPWAAEAWPRFSDAVLGS